MCVRGAANLKIRFYKRERENIPYACVCVAGGGGERCSKVLELQ